MDKQPGEVWVAISVPNMGYTQVEAYGNRMMNFFHLGKLQERGLQERTTPRFKFFFSSVGRMFTPVARDWAARHALELGCDYLYMIDDDMMCPDDMFEKLYENQVDIVAPLAFTRNPPHKPVLFECKEGYDHTSKKDYFLNHSVMRYKRDTLQRCDAVGFGAVLIKTDVLRKMKEKNGNEQWFMSTCGTGEDIFFCYQAGKLAGAKVYMDTRVKLGHISNPPIIDENYVDAFRKNQFEGDFEKKFGESNKYEPITVVGDKW